MDKNKVEVLAKNIRDITLRCVDDAIITKCGTEVPLKYGNKVIGTVDCTTGKGTISIDSAPPEVIQMMRDRLSSMEITVIHDETPQEFISKLAELCNQLNPPIPDVDIIYRGVKCGVIHGGITTFNKDTPQELVDHIKECSEECTTTIDTGGNGFYVMHKED